jgi:hypothetical protein
MVYRSKNADDYISPELIINIGLEGGPRLLFLTSKETVYPLQLDNDTRYELSIV